MKKLFSVLKYAKNYKGYLTANVTFNILFALFNAVSLTLAMPFLKLLFEDTNLIESGLILMKGKPQFALNADYIKDVSNYYITGLIVTQGGKMKALIIICVIIFVMTFFKNLFRYLAMFFIAPIRNGVVRDLRNKMYKKSLDLPLSYYSEEKKGDLMSRMTSDVQEIEWSIMPTLEMIFREPLTVILLFSLMILLQPSFWKNSSFQSLPEIAARSNIRISLCRALE